MEFLNKIGQENMIPAIAIFMGCLVAIIAIISGCLSKHAKIRQDADLRKNMLDRGMSAGEIELAMRGFGAAAENPTSAEESHWYDAELAKLLASSRDKFGKPFAAETIGAILVSFRQAPANEKETIFGAIQGMIEEEVGQEQLVAAVHGLCRSVDRPAPVMRPTDTNEMMADLPLEMRH